MQKQTVAIIPARIGSKRIPRKNIRLFAGKPMLSYSIKAAVEADVFDRIIVSTDSADVATIAREYDAEIPFMRPAELADDYSGTKDVLKHALNWFVESGVNVDYFCCIYAPVPFLEGDYIRAGLDLLKKESADSVFSVGKLVSRIQKAFKLEDNGRISMYWPEYESVRTNDIPEAYIDAGQFYWANAETYMKNWQYLSSNTMPVVLPRHLVHDIDTEEDWEFAELFYKALELKRESSDA